MESIITTNEQALEPSEYFKILKGQLAPATEEKLAAQLGFVAEQLIAAKRAGQDEFLKRLSFTYRTIEKEQLCLANGIDQFVYRDDIKRFIDIVEPKNSIKIIELSRYARAIPVEVLTKIQETKALGLFDDYCVVYTDFTNEAVERTEEEKAFIAKNRDPILFGYFKHEAAALKHDRFYFIADWIDEYCELTFTQMLAELGQEPKKIAVDGAYLTEIISSTYKDMEERDNSVRRNTPKPKRTLWQRIWG